MNFLGTPWREDVGKNLMAWYWIHKACHFIRLAQSKRFNLWFPIYVSLHYLPLVIAGGDVFAKTCHVALPAWCSTDLVIFVAPCTACPRFLSADFSPPIFLNYLLQHVLIRASLEWQLSFFFDTPAFTYASLLNVVRTANPISKLYYIFQNHFQSLSQTTMQAIFGFYKLLDKRKNGFFVWKKFKFMIAQHNLCA